MLSPDNSPNNKTNYKCSKNDREKYLNLVVSGVKYKADNGILEGLKSLIQAVKAKAKGYRTFKNFHAIIYLISGKLDFSKTGLPT